MAAPTSSPVQFRQSFLANFDVAIEQSERSAYFAKRISVFFSNVAKAEAELAQDIINHVQHEREKVKVHEKDLHPSFWETWGSVQEMMINYANIHAQFSETLIAKVAEPMQQLYQMEEEKRKDIVTQEKKLADEVQIAVDYAAKKQASCVKYLNIYRSVKEGGSGEHETMEKEKEKEKEKETSWSFSSLKSKMSGALSSLKSSAAASFMSKEEHLENACDKARHSCESYKNAVENANKIQTTFYQQHKAQMLDELQNVEESRLDLEKNYFKTFADMLSQTVPLLQDLSGLLIKQISKMNSDADLKHLIKESLKGRSQALPDPISYSIPAELQPVESEVYRLCTNSAPNGHSRSRTFSDSPFAESASASLATKDYKWSLQQLMAAQHDKYPDATIPVAVSSLISAVRPHLGLEGIFRLSASSSDLDALRQQIIDKKYDAPIKDGYVPAALLKEIFRADPLFPSHLYSKCIDITKLAASPNPPAGLAEQYSALLDQLPPVNKNIVLVICSLILEAATYSAQSKMTVSNLAIVFSPGFLRNPSQDPMSLLVNTKYENQFVIDFVQQMEKAGLLAALS